MEYGLSISNKLRNDKKLFTINSDAISIGNFIASFFQHLLIKSVLNKF